MGIVVIVLLLIFLIPIIFGTIINVKSKNKDVEIPKEDLNLNINLQYIKDLDIDLEKVKVFISKKNKVEEISLEEYVLGVVSSEMPASFEREALIAQAILARTFVLSKKLNPCKKANGADICDSVHCQAYTNAKEKEKSLNKNNNGLFNKISEAIKECESMVLSYNEVLVRYPQYFSTSSGRTEDAKSVFAMDIPYLKSVESLGEEISPKYNEVFTFSLNDFIKKFNSKYSNSNLNTKNISNNIQIISKNPGGTINELKIGGVSIKGTEFRYMYGLNSANFNIIVDKNKVIIECFGYGHAVGMSQWGANVMAKNKKNHKEILQHYYTGCEVIPINQCRIE
ncbi:stage II sporulation protein D [Clostridium tarantellae]|uniref:Stage II sporulation protein D n=1 Tax=Clostridium tarantellae TaxID=39493 RepID=A0A6I1MGP5_9CLOT|nr:stage II sporulation protein D [Clostridium tarantellae]